MTEPRSKADKEAGNLSETAKTYCETWLKEHIYNREKFVSTKYMDKGIQLENKAIEFVENYYKYDFLVKNEKRFDDGFLTGEPDLILPDCIRDTKCSWDCWTFPLFETKLDKTYYWQMQGYMALVGRDKAYVDYVLLDTPEELDPFALSYNNVPIEKRIKTFEVLRDDNAYLAIKQKVKKCREYIKSLE